MTKMILMVILLVDYFVVEKAFASEVHIHEDTFYILFDANIELHITLLERLGQSIVMYSSTHTITCDLLCCK